MKCNYSVLQRIQHGVLLRDGTMLTTVYFPKNGKPPGEDAEALGVPAVVATEHGLVVNKVKVDLSGKMTWTSEPPDSLFKSGALQARTPRQKALVEEYLRGYKCRQIVPTL